jgi:hypothetical protein
MADPKLLQFCSSTKEIIMIENIYWGQASPNGRLGFLR